MPTPITTPLIIICLKMVWMRPTSLNVPALLTNENYERVLESQGMYVRQGEYIIKKRENCSKVFLEFSFFIKVTKI